MRKNQQKSLRKMGQKVGGKTKWMWCPQSQVKELFWGGEGKSLMNSSHRSRMLRTENGLRESVMWAAGSLDKGSIDWCWQKNWSRRWKTEDGVHRQRFQEVRSTETIQGEVFLTSLWFHCSLSPTAVHVLILPNYSPPPPIISSVGLHNYIWYAIFLSSSNHPQSVDVLNYNKVHRDYSFFNILLFNK